MSERREQYYINDIRGSVAMILDTVGIAIAELEYYPFGSVLTQTGESHLKYTGKELDPGYDFDLYYYGARYYNSEWGRFISPDPVREYYNRYSYVRNNPIYYVDYEGKFPLPYPTIYEIVTYCLENAENFLTIAHAVIEEDYDLHLDVFSNTYDDYKNGASDMYDDFLNDIGWPGP